MEEIGELVWMFLSSMWKYLYVWNTLFAIIIIFFERRNPKSVWAWLLLLYFIPFLGFLFYLLLGADMHKRKMFREKELEENLNNAIRHQEQEMRGQTGMEDFGDYEDLIRYNYNMEGEASVLTRENDIDFFFDGNDKFEALIRDLEAARHFIHIEYYIIKKDELFDRISEVLIRKAAEGVEVRVLYDGMGCRSVSKKYWKELNRQGIMTAEFFRASLRWLHLRINYRNHRKIVVIDNQIGYVGGFNIGREYIDKDKRFGHWRDTHLRIVGEAVLGLQLRFLLDWNYASQEQILDQGKYYMLPTPGVRDHCAVQIITSGPDNTKQQIRDNYVRLIHKAKRSIYMQTPYFIPDESMMDALLIALRSGVEVNLMIPCKPDHPFVYWATYSYVGDLVREGARCYTYDNGFLHSKGMVVDEEVLCYGTANLDIRSFSLNFEVNAVVYDKAKAHEMAQAFRNDLTVCSQITREVYDSRSLWIRFREQICRLLSPLL